MKEVFLHYQVYKNGNELRGTYESYTEALSKAKSLVGNESNYVEIWKVSLKNSLKIKRLVAFWN